MTFDLIELMVYVSAIYAVWGAHRFDKNFIARLNCYRGLKTSTANRDAA